MPLLTPGLGRPGTANPWGSQLLCGREGVSVLLYPCRDIAVVFAGRSQNSWCYLSFSDFEVFWWSWGGLHPNFGSCPGESGLTWFPASVCGQPACACVDAGVRVRRKFFSRNKEDKEKTPGAARTLLSGLCPVGIPLPAHTSGETSDKSNSFVMLCWMCAYCVQWTEPYCMSILARFWEPWHFAIPAARCPSLKEKLPERTRLGPPRNVISDDQSLISPGSQKKFFWCSLL